MNAARTQGTRRAVVLSAILFAAGGGPLRAATFQVPSSYPTIQAGIDAAAAGDTVLVAPGVYEEYQTRGTWTSCAFLKDGVTVRSEGGPGVTTIPLTHMTGPQRMGVVARDLESKESSFEGFTLIGPNALGVIAIACRNVPVQGCIFRAFDGGPTVGGAAIVNGDATFVSCQFVDCTANSASAIVHSSGSLALDMCTFLRCDNAAVYCLEPPGPPTSAHVTRSAFIDNVSGGTAALVLNKATLGAVVSDCVFIGNVNNGSGGGGLSCGQGERLVENCVFIENKAYGGNGRGGGISAPGTSFMTFRGNTFVDNEKVVNTSPGGSIDVGANSTLENNIFVGSKGGAAVSADVGLASSSCNVFWDNPLGAGIPLSPTDREVDPLFCDREGRDFSLQPGSPCLPEDPIGCGLIGAVEETCGTVSLRPESWGGIKGLYR